MPKQLWYNHKGLKPLREQIDVYLCINLCQYTHKGSITIQLVISLTHYSIIIMFVITR